ncbi:MAG TPA: sugar ABC transporter permease [Oscillatoriaceae cyanobacterium M33_DOE_052]|uniref:Sugar ABC transporter permease n=1 Tax=Planktothricoides sp. SpSt-374 TaxID=2282167 RepID=A0A7C3ZN36_9CYAN|nr:sugar ABC transporter permease [Oscillatoriaceae cyanobacterium M33_DOE_052]
MTNNKMKDSFAAAIFLAPALILLGTFVIWPVINILYLSFTTGSFTASGTRWVGLRNYQNLLLSPEFWEVIGNTVYFTVATVIPSLIIPLVLANALNRPTISTPLRDLLRSAYFIPSITSLVAVGLGWRWMFQNNGPVNSLLGYLHITPVSWLSSTTWAMPVLILLSIWKQLGFNMVVFLAGLQAIPRQRYEAAELDGASDWQQFWYITLPGLRPTLVFATVTTVIFTLRSFEQVYVITGGGPQNSTNLVTYYIYQEAFALFEFGPAATAATILLAVTLVLVHLQLRVWGEDR